MPIFQKNDNVHIYYELLNDQSDNRELCVLIGGLTRDHTIWRKVVPLLIQENYKVLIFDNRDAGQSSSSHDAYGIVDMADDVTALIQYLNYYPAHIIGHSMGGFMAMHMAAKNPELVKTLILCGTSEKQEPAGVDYLEARIAFIDKQLAEHKVVTTSSETDVRAVLDKLYASENLKNAALVDEIIQHETHNPHPQSAESFKRQARACMSHDASKIIQDIACSVLILTGESDRYYTPEVAQNLAAKLKNAKVGVIRKAAHMLQIEQPESFVKEIHGFLTENLLYDSLEFSIGKRP